MKRLEYQAEAWAEAKLESASNYLLTYFDLVEAYAAGFRSGRGQTIRAISNEGEAITLRSLYDIGEDEMPEEDQNTGGCGAV